MKEIYKKRDAYVCKHGHIKYIAKYLEPDICNICGTKEFSEVIIEREEGEDGRRL